MERRNLFPILGSAALAAQTPFLPKFFTGEEAQAVARLSEIILPGAEAAGAIRYIDLVLKYDSAEAQQNFRRLMGAVDADARRRFGKAIHQASAEQQQQLVAAMAEKEGARSDAAGRFFTLLKRLTIEAYHYSAHHWRKDIGRDLNVALAEFPACNHKNHA